MADEQGTGERARGHGGDGGQPATRFRARAAGQVLSAAIPVMVRVSTVVVRSGTAILRAAASWIPIAAPSPTISAYRKPATGGLPLSAARMTEAARNSRRYSAPTTLKSWLTKTWCGQLTPM